MSTQQTWPSNNKVNIIHVRILYEQKGQKLADKEILQKGM